MINFNAFTPSRFSCNPVIRECLWMKTQIEKKNKFTYFWYMKFTFNLSAKCDGKHHIF